MLVGSLCETGVPVTGGPFMSVTGVIGDCDQLPAKEDICLSARHLLSSFYFAPLLGFDLEEPGSLPDCACEGTWRGLSAVHHQRTAQQELRVSVLRPRGKIQKCPIAPRGGGEWGGELLSDFRSLGKEKDSFSCSGFST